jgi:hypothetical protein
MDQCNLGTEQVLPPPELSPSLSEVKTSMSASSSVTSLSLRRKLGVEERES